ncbi:WD repeat-containing protein 49 [Exaiptasia diaphana]|uniref:WD repeat-containing protein on Y chromosome n=1 Tax=Exaiptasia diaphana TaxID=2652724 RepID=A0A913YWA4_EXADI|nr:WD repeat-containing protein 49 [Exaiptasia diaphana]
MDTENENEQIEEGSENGEEELEQVAEGYKESDITVDEGLTQAPHNMIKLEDQMNNENLEMLQQIFEEADEDGGGGLDLDEFRQAMIKTMAGKGELPDDHQLSIIFMKVDANCDGTVDWEEFCSYMLLENQLKDVMTSEDREMEFPFPAREIPSAHRDSMPRITYFPKMSHSADDPADHNGGRYVTISKDGIIQFWSMDFNPLRTHSVGYDSSKSQRSMWVTDCVVLPNAKKIAVASADRMIAFYDCSANSFDKQFILCGLDHCVLSMDYWCNPQKLNEGILLFGDAGGNVSSIKFSAATTSLFDLSIGPIIPTVNCRRVPFPEILLGRHANVKAVQFTGLHNDWVRKVKYYPTLQCFISCASSTDYSMYLGDVDRKKTKSMFRTRKGINSFDYCKEWNVIVTGGLDHHLRLWNPYVPMKPSSILKGHSASIKHILINSDRGEIISAAEDKVIKIWDMRDLCCVQTIPSRSLLRGPHPISSLYYSSKLHCILVGTNQFSVLEGKNEEPSEEREIASHTKPLCAALYNDLFDQVVSACHDSVVCVWNIENGEKIIQFSNAHGDSEITAMTFDQSKRRLITGARDGTVKIWNFNNGCCLRELEPVDDEEITGILAFKQTIIVVGWSKKIIMYKDCRDDEEDVPRVWPGFHKDDILSISFYPPNLVATSSYDGDIKIWNMETGHTSCVLNASRLDLPDAVKPLIPLSIKRRISKNNAVLSAVLADPLVRRESLATHRHSFDKRFNSPFRKMSILKDPSVIAMSKRARSISTAISPIEVKDTDYDSVVDLVLFLPKREHHRETANLLTGESGGLVRAWSTCSGKLLGQFMATRDHRESVTALATDENNTIFISGDTVGYVRMWKISDYCIKQENNDQSTSTRHKRAQVPGKRLPSIQETSPQLILQQNKTVHQINYDTPPLKVRFRAHVNAISSLDYVSWRQLIVTASADCSVRLWSHEGIYIGTFGQKALWDLERITADVKKLPHDVHRVASTDTLARLSKSSQKWRVAKHILRITRLGGHARRRSKSMAESDPNLMLPNIDRSLKDVLGKHYKPKTRHRLLPPMQKPRFNQNQIVVYSSLPYKEMESLEEPRLPSSLGCSHRKSSSTLFAEHHDKARHVKLHAGTPTKPSIFRSPASRGSARKHVTLKSPETS